MELFHDGKILRKEFVVEIVNRSGTNDIFGSNLRERWTLVAFLGRIDTFSKCRGVADTNTDGASLFDDDFLDGGIDEDLTTKLTNANVLSCADGIRSSL